ncbi:subunit TIM44 of mitochondrial import inner membrane translocase [Chloropicon primus]|uniref:Subunit TIM44 of mitochondrial import inner membrane translocase n=1 Tax=Chloropicon primus TaxID=1764295 RepID=A0A5B8MQB8_9CHLO|nr:subunit TIM44 of mitochondrial import inner membrane translocase [Chloropicon primus]UPR01943.1 subunit TIM44 of mitochondrial import inner membrane translocase [Chloropicon primus]|mmetsp:Transcript_5216/g.15665  ORF Transcript_5216/g.15665 Transcript_5216/m.15665 type:complete len:352 (-) Transcript_5216:3437-4492(-)|eukprot:QDZ22719.1 subunit TIM44 of mitochondrial import inner membrane translocase [Chloropicon primus]
MTARMTMVARLARAASRAVVEVHTGGATSTSAAMEAAAPGGARGVTTMMMRRSYATESSKESSEEEKKDAFGFAKKFTSLVRDELKDMFDMKESDVSTTRRRPEYKQEEYTGTTDVAVAEAPEKTGWSKQWDEVKDQAKTTAFFQKVLGLKEHKLVQRANEVAEDLRDRWETSDNTLVHKIQDNLQETEFAAATREIRVRDPSFDMVDFLRDVKRDIVPVMNAYLKGDMDVLKEHCSKEVCERVEAQQKFLKQEGAIMDSRILDIKEVHLFDVKSFENSPLVIIRFALQQIKCVRDKYGNILEGAADEIQAVDYLWALQQDSAGTYDKGKYLPPRWILRECQGIQEMKQIV